MRGRVHMREVGVEQEEDKLYHLRAGEVPKWPKGAVSKTVSRCKPSRGSNPRFSANLIFYEHYTFIVIGSLL